MFLTSVLVVLLPICLANTTDVTFKNVVFSVHQKFRGTIKLANSLKDVVPGSPNVSIRFSFEKIPVLYKDSLANIHLNKLVLDNSGLSKIHPGSLTNTSLTKLSLKGNKLRKIEKGVFNKMNVSWIDLSENRITTIHSKAFDNLHTLQIVDLSSNKIKRWNSDWFQNTPELGQVNLNENSISQLSNDAFRNLGGIKIDSSQETIYLGIDLSYNKIKTIQPNAFNGLTEVKYLRLNNNRLKEFHVDLLQGVNVGYLDLSKNKIRCLEGDLAKFNANETDLHDNPLICKCSNKINERLYQNDSTISIYYSYPTNCYL